MNSDAKRVEKRLQQVLAAWETLRPAKTFGGMTLEQAKQALQPSLTIRQRLVELQSLTAGTRRSRQTADRLSIALLERIVGGVKADPEETGDGDLYRGMGYVPKTARRSGLSRSRKAPESAVPLRAAA